MKRSSPLKRGKPLARGTKRLKARKVPKAFRHRRDPAYCAWVRGQPCLLQFRTMRLRAETEHRLHVCWGGVQVCHVRSRGAGGDDDRNVVPMCALAHTSQHSIGRTTFERRWGLDLKQAAINLYGRYTQERLNESVRS